MALSVLHVASEVYPYSRSGGLADVLGALPAEQARLGAEVAVISPWYAPLGGERSPREVTRVAVPGLTETARVGVLREGGVTYVFVGLEAFARERLYGYPDDVRRFCDFARAVPLAAAALGLRPSVIHAHDWSSGLVPAILRYTDVPPSQRSAKLVYTIHNLQYQGRWNAAEVLAWTGLPGWLLNPEGIEFYGDVNLMKAGIVCSDFVTTVSPHYAWEITTPEYGEGLDGILRVAQARGRLGGILNGLDQERWDPRSDPYVPHYADLEGKGAARALLRREFGFDDRPIVGMVTRLADQKGIDLVLDALPTLLRHVNVVILGGGDTFYEGTLTALSEGSRVLGFRSGLNEELAHRIYAGSDAFLMPSRFEPCGLSQMIAMRYGTLPIVRDTGGLHDTVSPDIGFLFLEQRADALLEAARRAKAAAEHPGEWQRRVQAAMALDWSWRGPASEYLELYGRL